MLEQSGVLLFILQQAMKTDQLQSPSLLALQPKGSY